MLDHNDLLPEESQAENQSLIQHLERLHDTHVQDAISFERMQQRLAQTSSEDQPISSSGTFSSMPSAVPVGHHGSTHIIQKFRMQQPWQRVLTTAVAVIVIALVLASLTFALLRFQQSPPASPQTYHYKNGWVFVQSFSGTGSKKLTNLHIGPLQIIGMTANCSDPTQQSAKFDLNLQVIGNPGLHNGSNTDNEGGCSGNLSMPPQIYGVGVSNLDGSPLVANSLTVTVSPDMRWQVFIFKNTNPPLTLDNSQWSSIEGPFSSYGASQPSMMEANIATKTSMPRTVAIKSLCYGSGNLQVIINNTINSADRFAFTSVCDGKIHEKKFSVTPLDGVDNITAQAGAGCEWYVLMEGHK